MPLTVASDVIGALWIRLLAIATYRARGIRFRASILAQLSVFALRTRGVFHHVDLTNGFPRPYLRLASTLPW